MEYPFGVIDCESTVVAAFAANGDLSITQPASACKPAGESWLASIMKCARRNDDEASCIDRSEGIAQDTEVLFRRE